MRNSQIVVLGMHRSGTSVLTQLLHSMGCWVGVERELLAGDQFNPTGYWEHGAVVALDQNVLRTVSGTWFEGADLGRLSREQWTHFVDHARRIVAHFDQHGTWAAKDPRMVILFPLWREALRDPICVLIWRDPLAVARSLAARQGFAPPFGLLVWELYVRTMLAETIGMRRVLVSYRNLVDEPEATARRLQEQLRAWGADLTVPADDALAAVVQKRLDRKSAGTSEHLNLLDSRHHQLIAALRDGSALSWTHVPGLPPAAQASLDAFCAYWRALTATRVAEGAGILRGELDW